jgi:hypothetical protein
MAAEAGQCASGGSVLLESNDNPGPPSNVSASETGWRARQSWPIWRGRQGASAGLPDFDTQGSARRNQAARPRRIPVISLWAHRALSRGRRPISDSYRTRGGLLPFGASATVQQFADAYFRERAKFASGVFL